MCNQECCDGIHKELECSIFAAAEIKKTISDFGEFHPFYQCIAALRCLLLKETNTVKWNTLKLMMDHNTDRMKNEHWNICQHNIVHYLIKVWKLDFSPEEVNHVIGLIEVNAFEVRIGNLNRMEECGIGRGVFPLLAMLSHNCISNSRYINLPGGWMECRATVHIKKGEEIFIHYVSPVDNTQSRTMALSTGWYFDCLCARCADKTECGTFMSAYICHGLKKRELNEPNNSCDSLMEKQDICYGLVLATNSTDHTTNYRCDSCGNVFENNLINRVRKEVENEFKKTSKTDLFELEKLLEVNKSFLYSSHSIILAIKRHIIYIYGRNPEVCMNFCKELLGVYDVVLPGLTKERGLTMYELFVSCSQLGQADQLLDLLKEAKQCLEHEREGTFEYEVRAKVNLILQYMI